MAEGVTINSFAGSIPRLAPHLIRTGQAKLALDCNLHSGKLASWRELHKERATAQGTLKTIFFDCCWLDLPSCADYAEGGVTCKSIYVTGWRDYPVEVSFDEACFPEELRLGIPCPSKKLSATHVTDGDSVDRDLEGRSYAYQYEDSKGNRGALSVGTNAKNIKDGSTHVLSGWEIPDASWGVSKVRFYRIVSGHETGGEPANQDDTSWMFIGEANIGDSSFTDSLYNEDLQEALEVDNVTPPPDNLQGIIWIESINTLAGFSGNRLHFSENNHYHNWEHFLDLDDNIRGITESNGDVYVATDGGAYIVKGDVDCQSASCRAVLRLPGAYPMTAYGNRHIASIKAGAVYPSHEGLVVLSGSSAPSVLTWAMYSPEAWQAMEPHTAIPVEFGGKLFVFLAQGAFVMIAPSSSEQGWDASDHSDLSDRGVIDAFVTRQGRLMLLMDDGVYEWNRGASLRQHKWMSNEFVGAVPFGIGAGNLYFQNGEESVKIEVDGRVALNRSVPSSRVFRLPMWANGNRWTVTLEGTAEVSLLSLSPTMLSLGA